jgi:hypothetical protein
MNYMALSLISLITPSPGFFLMQHSAKLLKRIAFAYSAILGCLEDGHSSSLNGEQCKIQDALTALQNLEKIELQALGKVSQYPH